MSLVFHPTGVDGTEAVYRSPEDPKPFAVLVPPRTHGGRAWGIEYRNSGDVPFNGECNKSCKTRADAVYDLEHAARVCSDYQLGLV